VKEPLPPATVKRLLVELRAAGILSFTKHAYEEMAKDDLTEIDVRNTLRGGMVRLGELVSGTWRYRVETNRMAAVVTFRSATHAVVVTAWRFKT
jgi:DNA-binding IclR family transcriptional regulator